MKIAVAQINSTSSPQDNLVLIQQYCEQAVEKKADLIIFPEAAMANFTTQLAKIAQSLHDEWAQKIRRISDQLEIAIVAGMFTPYDAVHVQNTVIFARPHQELVPYHKVHLFDAFDFQESATIVAGGKAIICDYKTAQLGFATCYDLRFPQLFHALAVAGANIIIVCASWGAGPDKLRQWKLLVQARALDTGSWIIACDQAVPVLASDSQAPLGIGHSMICSPWGETLLEMNEEAGLVIYDCDPVAVMDIREHLGVIANYKQITEVQYIP